MGSKVVLEDKRGVKLFNRKKHDCVNSRPAKSCSSYSTLLSPKKPGCSRCKEKLVEFFCSCCLLCVCCPLAIVCCCIKLPCRMFQKALHFAWNWACYGSKNRIFADYSSFSDIDSDVTFGKPNANREHSQR